MAKYSKKKRKEHGFRINAKAKYKYDGLVHMRDKMYSHIWETNSQWQSDDGQAGWQPGWSPYQGWVCGRVYQGDKKFFCCTGVSKRRIPMFMKCLFQDAGIFTSLRNLQFKLWNKRFYSIRMKLLNVLTFNCTEHIMVLWTPFLEKIYCTG